MSCSLILTTYNEASNISALLSSISSQTLLPSELVIVDAGSSDQTVRLIKDFAKTSPFPVRVTIVPRCTRSQGRNAAIASSSHDIIAATDAGCVLDHDWLKLITQPFTDPHISIVAGSYRLPTTLGILQRATSQQAAYLPSDPHDPEFLPSSRSIAFRKSAWITAGKYPEYLNTAEDLVFAQNLHKANLKQVTIPEAFVTWFPPSSPAKIIKQFYSYSYGDGLAGNFSPHTIRYYFKTCILSIYLAVCAFLQPGWLLTILGFLLLLALPAIRRSLTQRSTSIIGIAISPILSLATLGGFWHGAITRIMTRYA